MNGRQHYEYVPYYHKKPIDFINQKVRDNRKRILCFNHHIQLIIIKYINTFNEKTAEKIYQEQVRPVILNKKVFVN